MTSPYLLQPLRSEARALRDAEIRDEERQGGRVDAARDETDELEFLADKAQELRWLT